MSNPEQADFVQKGAEMISENRRQVANQRRQTLILQREARRQALSLKREERRQAHFQKQEARREKGEIRTKRRLEHDRETARVTATKTNKFSYSILHWNIESGGNDPATIAEQLIELGRYDIIALSEVGKPETYERAINEKWPSQFGFVLGKTGYSDRLLTFFDCRKFELVESDDMQEAGGVMLNKGRHRAPLYVRLKDKVNGQELVVIGNHLARCDNRLRQQQARGLREWARTKSVPTIAIGDYNFDYNFNTQKGNHSFDEFLKDGVWKWIKPVEMIDTNWSGKNGVDEYPDSMLDFSFVAGAAKEWNAKSRIIVRDGDFPDDKKTSDHRPVELILSK